MVDNFDKGGDGVTNHCPDCAAKDAELARELADARESLALIRSGTVYPHYDNDLSALKWWSKGWNYDTLDAALAAAKGKNDVAD